MGTLTVTDKEARFTYEADYKNTGLRGLGLAYPPEAFSDTIVRDRNEYFSIHPPLQGLIPPKDDRNFQRALLLKYLEKSNIHPEMGFDTDWQMLIKAGHGAIGHLDVFESDEAALLWYATPSKKGLVELDEKFGFSLKEFMTWFDNDADILLDILGPTPTVGGAIPKLPLSISKDGWDGRIGLPTRFGDTDRTDILLKLENTTAYPGIIELEILGLDIHDKAGFDVPRFWPVEVNGLRALAIERFDRSNTGKTIFMESIHSVLASGSRNITNHYSATYDQVGKALDVPQLQLVDDRKAAKLHLLERFVMALLTGNGDLHLQNMSIVDRDGKLDFSPVYDPVPMRAYSMHNALVPTGMTFGGFGAYPNDWKGEDPVDFKSAFVRFNKSLGIQQNKYTATLDRLLKATEDFPAKVKEMETLPQEHKKRLIDIHNDIRQRFEDV